MSVFVDTTVFVDTNVFVYARDLSQGAKHERAREWVDRLWNTGRGRLCVQVLNELYVTLTRKLDPGLPVDDARADVRDLAAWGAVPVTAELIELAWGIEDAFGFSYWDALVVAAARVSGATHLLTEDLQHEQEVEGLVVIDPFAVVPQHLLGT